MFNYTCDCTRITFNFCQISKNQTSSSQIKKNCLQNHFNLLPKIYDATAIRGVIVEHVERCVQILIKQTKKSFFCILDLNLLYIDCWGRIRIPFNICTYYNSFKPKKTTYLLRHMHKWCLMKEIRLTHVTPSHDVSQRPQVTFNC